MNNRTMFPIEVGAWEASIAPDAKWNNVQHYCERTRSIGLWAAPIGRRILHAISGRAAR